MVAALALPIDRARMDGLCRRWKVSELAIFGSATGNSFSASSDVDVLVKFRNDARPTLWMLGAMRRELQEILGREVDLLERPAVEQMKNDILRESILENARVIYAG